MVSCLHWPFDCDYRPLRPIIIVHVNSYVVTAVLLGEQGED